MLAGPCNGQGPVIGCRTAYPSQIQLGLLHSREFVSSHGQPKSLPVPRSCATRLRSYAATAQQRSGIQAAEPSEQRFSVSQNREYERAKNSAIGSLSLRPHSRKELVDKLIDKGYSQEAIKRALDRLKELREDYLKQVSLLMQEVQSDADYAEVYARSKWRQSRWAPSRIQQELTRKGVGREDCRNALEGLFGESLRGSIRVNLDNAEDGLSDDESICGTEERVDQHLLGSARRQADFTAGLPIEARRRRLVGWLQRRGHDWETITRVLALLQLK